MKKALATILAVIYLSTSIGATVHFHYCMGKLASWGLTDQHSSAVKLYTCPIHSEISSDHPGNCSKCGMAMLETKKIIPVNEKIKAKIH
jgi:hypothetical protein